MQLLRVPKLSRCATSSQKLRPRVIKALSLHLRRRFRDYKRRLTPALVQPFRRLNRRCRTHTSQRLAPLCYHRTSESTSLSTTMSSSFTPSSAPISDLDGFSVSGDSRFPQMQSTAYTNGGEDFGFDPPAKNGMYPYKMEQMYSPLQESSPFNSFSFDGQVKHESAQGSPFQTTDTTRATTQAPSHTMTAISRYGQVTPPRSNSESSTDKSSQQKATARQRRSTKSSTKEESAKPAGPGRRRKNARRESIVSTGNPEEDHKRKHSLEKNRLAAAKCRINKKEKTEQLQRDSHDKAVQNAFLKDQLMRMREEVQQMNGLLLAHANCEGCQSPEDIQKHLNDLGNEFLAQHMSGIGHDYSGYNNMAGDMSDMEHEHYFSSATDAGLMNPPLPEFDRETEFDVTTPIHAG